jgi:ankyrin repeat protein
MKHTYYFFMVVAFLSSCTSSVSKEDFNMMILQGDVAAVEESISRLPKDEKVGMLIEGLSTACFEANEEMALLLLENGAIGTTPALMQACKNRMTEVALKIFESNDESGDELDQNGSSALQYALAYGQPEVAEQLLTVASQPVNMQSNFFYSPLYIAAEQGYVDLIPTLLNKKADVNMQNPDGMTAIFPAIKKGNTEVVRLLIENGADLEIQGSFADSKYTPLQWAQSSYTEANDEIIALLSE